MKYVCILYIYICETVKATDWKLQMFYLPYTTRDASRMVNANELVAGGSDVKVRLLLVDEECVGYPNILDEF